MNLLKIKSTWGWFKLAFQKERKELCENFREEVVENNFFFIFKKRIIKVFTKILKRT